MVVQARTGRLGQIATAVPDGKSRVYKVENILDVDGLHIRSEISCSVVSQFAHKRYRGIILAHIDTQKRIRLVVFEQNVVFGRMFLD